VAYERFGDARSRGARAEELLPWLDEAAGLYQQALEHFPPDAVDELAVAHNQLGNIYGDAGDLDRSLSHSREAIRYQEAQGNPYGASLTRRNVAVHLAQAGRRADALEYARAALRGFESYGERAAAEIEKTRRLIADIEGL